MDKARGRGGGACDVDVSGDDYETRKYLQINLDGSGSVVWSVRGGSLLRDYTVAQCGGGMYGCAVRVKFNVHSTWMCGEG